jgi:hypothetical protein
MKKNKPKDNNNHRDSYTKATNAWDNDHPSMNQAAYVDQDPFDSIILTNPKLPNLKSPEPDPIKF